MIEKISAMNSLTASAASQGRQLNYDIHNMSPNELDALTLDMFKKGEITLKQRLPFISIEQVAGEGFHTRYRRVFEDPDRKRDMLLEYNGVLQDKINGGDSKGSIDVVRDAIALLEKMNRKPAFEDILKNTMAT